MQFIAETKLALMSLSVDYCHLHDVLCNRLFQKAKMTRQRQFRNIRQHGDSSISLIPTGRSATNPQLFQVSIIRDPLINVYKYVPYYIKVSHVSCGWRAKSKFLNAHRSSVVCLQPIALH